MSWNNIIPVDVFLEEKPKSGCAKCNGDYNKMPCVYEGYDGERYRCPICKTSIFLDYDEMQ